MRIITIDKVTPGMRLGDPIRGTRGQVLLTKGAILTEAYVATLRSLNIPAIYVADPDTADIKIPAPISPETRSKVQRTLAKTFEEVAKASDEIRKASADVLRQNLEADPALKAAAAAGAADCLYAIADDVELLLDELGNQEVLTGLNSIKTHDQYTFQHSIDVTVMALVLARRARWDRARMRAFGVGCLLHDIGKILIDPDLLNKAGPLTPEEFELLKGHTTLGYEMIRAIAPRLGPLAPQVAFQHHERQDGTGYPRGLKGNNRLGENVSGLIHDFGGLAAVADVYDAMSSHRPYRPALPIDEVVETIKNYGGTHLNQEAVSIFLSVVPPYPVCSTVAVANGPYAGYQGVVVAVPSRDIRKPVIRLLYDAGGNRVSPIDIATDSERDLKIRCVRETSSPHHSLGSGKMPPKQAKKAYAIPAAVLQALKAS
jgi:putative nucleotidyltransferase with HDIG domain